MRTFSVRSAPNWTVRYRSDWVHPGSGPGGNHGLRQAARPEARVAIVHGQMPETPWKRPA
jgi:hypothetical protein